MSVRMEILRQDTWYDLLLNNNTSIKYNALINRIGSIDTREISHTNTFSIPYCQQNILAFGINIYNPEDLSRTLNTKFVANYYIDETLIQTGYLVINNTNNGTINLNFIDEALSIIDKWNSTTYYELLNSDLMNGNDVYSDYIFSIREAKGFKIPTTSLIEQFNSFSSTYPLLSFPNNLNTIGDNFQKDDNQRLGSKYFNSYQSRPVFNAMAFLDISCKAYGYSLSLPSESENRLNKTYMVSEGLSDNDFSSNDLVETRYPYVYSTNQDDFHITTYPEAIYDEGQFGGGIIGYYGDYYGYFDFKFNSTDTTFKLVPIDVDDASVEFSFTYNFRNDNEGINITEVKLIATWYDSESSTGTTDVYIDAPWSGGYKVTHRDILATKEDTYSSLAHISAKVYWEADKDLDIEATTAFEQYNLYLKYMRFINQSVPTDIVVYDDEGQFLTVDVNLLYAAPKVSLKKLFVGLLQKEGLLININSKNKEISLFTYSKYIENKENNIYSDWSSYFQKHMTPTFNTDYGSDYGQTNQIGLKDPYRGNSNYISLSHNNDFSKYEESVDNLVDTFKDVEQVVDVDNDGLSWFEYTNTGLGLVVQGEPLSGLLQKRNGIATTFAIYSLPSFENVNYNNIPTGISEWYQLVDKSLRVTASFILPVRVIKELDLRIPIYIEDLGGFFIIEEIEEYQNAQSITSVKLMKLIDFK